MPVVHNAMMLIKPSSVDITGGGSSATINDGGSVTFSSASTLSLNNVFSSTYDNYIIDVRHQGGNSDSQFLMRMRNVGTDDSSANYVYQYLVADGSTAGGARSTAQTSMRLVCTGDSTGGDAIYIYGPYLAQPTAARNVNMQPRSAGASTRILDQAATHAVSSSYDGFTLIPNGAVTFSGLIKVYGLRQ